MYTNYWKMTEKPFENTPDPRFLYWSRQHEEALSRMLYVVKERKGAALFTGEYGCGKTLLTRILLKELSGEEYQTALIVNPMLSPSQLIKEIIVQLGGEVSLSASKAAAFNRLNELLFDLRKNNKTTVIVVDEAQAISTIASFEEFRLMLNFQLNESFLLTLILLGQPELKGKMEKLPQLKQRMAITFHLKALNDIETRAYVLHRMEVAGADKSIFTEDSFSAVHQFSQGVPRKINNICDLALLVGSGESAAKIDQGIITKVAADLEGRDYGLE